MQAIVLAAGLGTRLKSLTSNAAKCMVSVNGETLIERLLRQLDSLALDRIIIVDGYMRDLLEDYICRLPVLTEIEFVENPIFDKTNNIYSLALVKDRLIQDDTLLLESDLIFDDSVLRELVDDMRPTLALVDSFEPWMDGTVVTLGEEDRISSIIPGKQMDFARTQCYFKTVNAYKFSKDFSLNCYVPLLQDYMKLHGLNEYYEQVLQVIVSSRESELRAKRLIGEGRWYEIDDVQDLNIAESMFAPGDRERYDLISGRAGGCWRYPSVVDFRSYSSDHYPTERLIEEMKMNFPRLVTARSSCGDVSSMLVANMFDIKAEYVAAGSKVVELIGAALHLTGSKAGILRVGGGESLRDTWIGRTDSDWLTKDLSLESEYSAAQIKDAFDSEDITAIVLSNPELAFGKLLYRADLEDLAKWCETRGWRLILDETLCDYAAEKTSLLANEFLSSHPSVVVVKSISCAHGLEGLHLGALISADTQLVDKVRERIGVHAIDSVAECYLQISGKYKKEFEIAIEQARNEREKMVARINAIPALTALHSESNYLIIRIGRGLMAHRLAAKLLADEHILVDYCVSSELCDESQLVRIALRGNEDNEMLLKALTRVVEGAC